MSEPETLREAEEAFVDAAHGHFFDTKQTALLAHSRDLGPRPMTSGLSYEQFKNPLGYAQRQQAQRANQLRFLYNDGMPFSRDTPGSALDFFQTAYNFMSEGGKRISPL